MRWRLDRARRWRRRSSAGRRGWYRFRSFGPEGTARSAEGEGVLLRSGRLRDLLCADHLRISRTGLEHPCKTMKCSQQGVHSGGALSVEGGLAAKTAATESRCPSARPVEGFSP
jgi:hypothetical protein